MKRNILLLFAVALLGVALLGGVVGAAAAVDPKLDPGTAPAPTFKTLDQVQPTWDQILPAAQRFKLVMGGVAVLDKETGLVWEKVPDTSSWGWDNALSFCYRRVVGGRLGWRLSTIEELTSLVDPAVPSPGPTLPSGHPFAVSSPAFWSASTVNGVPSWAWGMRLMDGEANFDDKSSHNPVWCVRGGRGYDAR